MAHNLRKVQLQSLQEGSVASTKSLFLKSKIKQTYQQSSPQKIPSEGTGLFGQPHPTFNTRLSFIP